MAKEWQKVAKEEWQKVAKDMCHFAKRWQKRCVTGGVAKGGKRGGKRDVSLGQHSGIERWGAGVETQKNVRGEIGGWGRVPFNEPYAPSLSTIYDGA